MKGNIFIDNQRFPVRIIQRLRIEMFVRAAAECDKPPRERQCLSAQKYLLVHLLDIKKTDNLPGNW